MSYVLPCSLPNFQQSAPRGDGWQIASNEDPRHSGQVTWRHVETGETIICPSIWYNAPASSYAKTLRFNAERSDGCAIRQDAEGKPWSAGEAARYRRQARRLRAMATLCDRSPNIPAGAVDFHGLSDPANPADTEGEVVSRIEAEG